MKHLRAVFEDGSTSWAYSAETEEEIRNKLKLAYFEKSKQNYVLVSANDDLAVSEVKKEMKRQKLARAALAAEERKQKRLEKKAADAKTKEDALVEARLAKINADLKKARELL